MSQWIVGLCLVIFSHSAFAGAKLTKVRFVSCTNKICIKINSKNAYQAILDGGSMSLTNATVSITDENGVVTKTFKAESVFYEVSSDRLLFRSMTSASSNKTEEAYYELSNNQMHIVASNPVATL